MAAEKTFLPALRFRALTPYFDRFVRATTREPEFKRRLVEGIDARPSAAILDLGAGTGTLALQLKERWPDARVTGLDADPEILAISRRRTAEAGREIEFVEGFSNELPFEDESFDLVTSTLFFHHIDTDTKAATLREVARVLRPGGALHVGDWGKAADPLQAAGFMTVRVFDGFDVTAANASGALPRMCEDAGLERVEVRERLRTALGTLDLIAARKPR